MHVAQSDWIASLLGSGVIAVATAVLFFLFCRALLHVGRHIRHRSIFTPAMMHAPGYRLRHLLDAQSDKLRVVSATLLLLPLTFAAVLLAWPDELNANLREWRWLGMLAVAVAIIGYLFFSQITLLLSQIRNRYSLSAHIAVSHALERVMKRDFSIFHDVDFGNVIADKIVVGRKGVFAVRVFVQRRGGGKKAPLAAAEYDGSRVIFPNGATHALTTCTQNQALVVAGHLSRLLGKQVPVCPVLVLPGWNLTCVGQPAFPVVNERNIDLMVEWTGPEAYLLDEDVEALQEHLAHLCRDRRYRD